MRSIFEIAMVLVGAAAISHGQVQFRAYYNGQDGHNTYHIASSFSDDGITWNRSTVTPLLSAGTGWESKFVKDVYAVGLGSSVLLFYSGYNGSRYQIGLALSTDYGHTFVKYPGNPVIPLGQNGSVDQNGAAFPVVIYDASEENPAKAFKMWYEAVDRNSRQTIAYAYSADGISWTKFGRVLDLGSSNQFDAASLQTGGAVIKIGKIWYFFYGGNHLVSGVSQWTGGLATFADPEGVYTKQGQILSPLSTHAGTLTADTVTGSNVITISDTSVFSVGEAVFLASTASPPMLSKVAAINSPTQLTIKDAAVADFKVSKSAVIRSVYYWSAEPRSVFKDQNGSWVMAVSLFQACRDINASALTELCGWAYNTNDPPTGPWTFAVSKGVALSFDSSVNESESAENFCVLPLTFP